MNSYLNKRLFNQAKNSNARIILPENDMRIDKAKDYLLSNNFNIINLDREKIDYYIDFISKFKFTQNWTKDMIREYLDDPIHLSCTMLACNDADCVVAGAITSTSKIIRTAIRIVGIDKKSKWVSSMFLMVNPNNDKIYAFCDCAVIPEPDIEQLVYIAIESSKMYHLLTNQAPKVAFLSFSTLGSASHYRVDKVRNATKKFIKKYPNVLCDGEVQLDAAIIPEISSKKIANSRINGDANILVFPNLDAGNIGYKIAQRMGGYEALGPLLQGLKKTVHDLSRGCSVDDVINIASIASIQSNYYANI